MNVLIFRMTKVKQTLLESLGPLNAFHIKIYQRLVRIFNIAHKDIVFFKLRIM